LRLRIDRDFYVFGEKTPEKNLVSFSAFSQLIDALPPSAEMIFYLGVSHKMFGSPHDSDVTPPTFVVDATYSFGGTSYAESTTVDLRPFLESAVPQDPIADEMEKMTKEVQQLREELRNWRSQSQRSADRIERPGES
jgi:hypothetical protein